MPELSRDSAYIVEVFRGGSLDGVVVAVGPHQQEVPKEYDASDSYTFRINQNEFPGYMIVGDFVESEKEGVLRFEEPRRDMAWEFRPMTRQGILDFQGYFLGFDEVLAASPRDEDLVNYFFEEFNPWGV